MLAEFYLSLAGQGGGFKKGEGILTFYAEAYQENPALTPSELYHHAVKSKLNN